MALISPIKLNIAEKLQNDKGFRERFFKGQAQDEIAMKIRSLRKKRNMRQVDLAKKAGMKQSAISRIEQADYSGWSFNILFRIANALDVKMKILFDPAENVIEQYKQKESVITSQPIIDLEKYITLAFKKEIYISSPPLIQYSTIGKSTATADSTISR